MNIREETLKIARNLMKKDPSLTDWVISKFPELAESEDERIRKKLLSSFKCIMKDADEDELWYGLSYNDIIAWLEKQGEQKSVCEVKPKFHEGDFIKHNKANIICKVISVNSGSYYLENIKISGRIELFFNAEQNFHLWTIKDAEPGDILCGYYSDFPWIGIFHKLNDDCTFNSYCYLQAGVNGKFCPPSGENIFNERNVHKHSSQYIYPATKEQRDLFFRKMNLAGYEWDADKKELKKVEKKPNMIQWKGNNLKEVIDFTGKYKNFDQWFTSFEEYERYVHEHNSIFKLFNEDGSHYEVPVGAWIVKTPDGYNVASNAVLKQKPTDKIKPKFKVGDKIQYLKGCGTIMTIEKIEDGEYIFGNNMGHTTIESGNKWHLVNLVEQNPAWSEEDERYLSYAIHAVEDMLGNNGKNTVTWLKSLKDRYTWKPSEKQINTLEYYMGVLVCNKHKEILFGLYTDLKKLR